MKLNKKNGRSMFGNLDEKNKTHEKQSDLQFGFWA
jgi:hypothetical protein